MKTKDLLGQRFGMGIVIAFVGHRSKGKTSKRSVRIWRLKCDCGKEYETITEYLTNGNCSSCGCYKTIFHNIPTKHKNTAMANANTYLRTIRYDAKRRNHAFLVSNKHLLELFEKQNGKCAISGMDISFSNKSASLDRKDNNLPYIDSNIQWVHRTVNFMKSTLPQNDFISLCKTISDYNPH